MPNNVLLPINGCCVGPAHPWRIAPLVFLCKYSRLRPRGEDGSKWAAHSGTSRAVDRGADYLLEAYAALMGVLPVGAAAA